VVIAVLLDGKVVYVVVTGATKAKTIGVLLWYLKQEGAQCILMPSDEGYNLLDLDSINNEWMKYDGRVYNPRAKDIPEEDLVVVAPCTFNTLSKIALGIADNYPISIVHAAIGKRKPVIIALAMNYWYFDHPLTTENIAKVSAFPKVSVIWPESVFQLDGTLEKVTMAPWEKIVDTIFHQYQKIRYESKQVDMDISKIVEKHFPEFFTIGKQLQENHYLNGSAGFLAKRIPEGVLVTSTGSYVGNLAKRNLTLIINWDENAVSWSGEKLPSSETPLILEIFDGFSDAQVIFHGHCRDITYSSRMVRYHSSEYLRYGQWGELFKINPILGSDHCGIMKLHGEIILGNDFNDAIGRYAKMYEETL
jgi:3-polyprenyl-4-hydroxybenzoate decarboxylase